MSKFIGVDGEGVTHADGSHDYVLLSVGNQSLYLPNGTALTYRDIFPFLYRQFVMAPDAAFVGFYLTYDFSQWFKDLPEQKAWFLLDPKGIALRQPKSVRMAPFPVRWDGWEFDILPNLRRFKLRPQNGGHKWLWVNDAGPFWQTSFLNAVNPKNWADAPVVTPELYARIRAGKDNRTDATLDADMIAYNVAENETLAKAMTRLDTGFRSQGWNLKRTQWFGPGQAAQQWLVSIDAPSRQDIEKVTPHEVLESARETYYGGWFEITRHGIQPGTTWEYDINSAYPAVIAELPCLLHGRWYRGDVLDGNRWQMAHVSTHGDNQYLGGLPHRDVHGIISRPQCVEGWYWADEIRAAVAASLIIDVDVREVWTYEPSPCPRPFQDIRTLYDQRLQVGKNTAQGKALKLVYNSAYGKFAQSVGSPRYANAIYASLITSGCRRAILGAIATHPRGASAVSMVATDGIYFDSPHPSLELSPNALGAWDESTLENLSLFMPGVYWDDETRSSLNNPDGPKLKSRGVNARDLGKVIHEIDALWEAFDGRSWPTFTLPIRFSVTSPKLALARHRWSTCGAITTDGTRLLSSDPCNKRAGTACRDGRIYRTAPYVDHGISVPYNKQFGMDLAALQDADDISDDGNVGHEIYELLTNRN